MNRKEIKKMQREIVLRPVKNTWKNYAYEAGRTLIGGLLFAGATSGAFLIAGILN